MATINNIKKRAAEIKDAYEPESVTAEKVGKLFEDIADVTEQAITSSEEVMQESVRASEQAAQAAEDASGYLANLQEAITELPDGQAVSAQVAINETDIARLKTNIVVDLSVRYSTSYANLSAALTALNSDVATDASAIKKAGVSIKFINSSTNKYEQWNLKASSWSTDTSDWALDVSGSVANDKLKLPLELEKPSSNKYVTQASEIGFLGRPLSEFLNSVKDMFIDDETGDICFVDGNKHIIFKLSSNGAEAKQFRVLNSSGELIGTIDSAFFQSVLKSSDVINNLTSSATNKPLSANQGKALKELIDSISENSPVQEDESNDTLFTDSNNYIIAKFASDGISSIAFVVRDSHGDVVGKVDANFFAQIGGLTNVTYTNGRLIFKDDSNNVMFSASLSEIEYPDSYIKYQNDGIFALVDSIGRIAFSVSPSGVLDAKAIGSNLTYAIKEALGLVEHKKIMVIGSSSVAGGGSMSLRNASYALDFLEAKGFDTSAFGLNVSGVMPFGTILNHLIGDSVNVVNLGVGGENIYTISARYGVYPALIPTGFDLPISKETKVMIASAPQDTFLLSCFDTTKYCKPLMQGGLGEINPCLIEGIPCELTCTYESGWVNPTYYVNRLEDGDRVVHIPDNAAIIPHNAQINRDIDFAIIATWYNGYGTNEELIEMIKMTASNCGCKDYIVLDKYSENYGQANTREQILQKAFGDRYFSIRRYFSTNALYDIGLTPTTDEDFTQEQLEHDVFSDTYLIGIGATPSSLWHNVYGVDGATSNDKAHCNRCGHMLIAYKLYERMVALGAIEDTRTNNNN